MAVQYTGVNLSGLEFGGTGGTLGTNYTSNSEAEYQYWSKAGANTIRLPFVWERLQPKEGGSLDASYLKLLHDAVNYAKSKGMVLILDLHNFANYNGQSFASGSSQLKNEFANIWSKLAVEFGKEPNVWFGIMNEPHDISATTWMQYAQAATNAIRATGAENKILVSTVDWSGAYRFNDANYNVEMGTYATFKDPANNFAFDLHQYLDPFSAGVSADAGIGTGNTVLAGAAGWARDNGFHLFLGEFGVAADGANATEYSKLLEFMKSNSDVFLGWTAWGAGEWWPTSYAYYLGPQDNSGTNILDDFFNAKPLWYGNEGTTAHVITGTTGNNFLAGTNGEDIFYGKSGTDILQGLSGNDVLNGQAGNDTLTGGAGNDTFVYQTGGGVDSVKDFNLLDDVIDIEVAGYSLFRDIQPLLRQWGANVAIYFDTNNYLILENVSAANLKAQHFIFSSERNVVSGTSLSEWVGGTNGRDLVLGGGGNDVLEGLSGSDILNGQVGSDVLIGGAGNDIFVYQKGGGIDYVRDFSLSDDVIHVEVDGFNSFRALQPLMSQWGPNVAIYFDANNYVVLENVSLKNLGYQHFVFSDTRSTILGTSAAEYLPGTNGRDFMLGGAGNDVLDALSGNDILNGQSGNDTLLGGAGSDIFVYEKNGGIDYFKDFKLSEDMISLKDTGYNSFIALQPLMRQWGPNVAVCFDTNNYFILENIKLSDLNDTQVLFS